LFPLFAPRINNTSETGGKILPPVSLIPVANLPSVSLIPVAILPPVVLTTVANLPPVSLILVVHLDLRIFEKNTHGETDS
jgi:hypothetical protein